MLKKCRFAVLAILTGLAVDMANASDRLVAVSPMTGVASKSGLQVHMTTEGIRKSGYRPVELALSLVAPAVADRYVAIELVPNVSNHESTYGFNTKVRVDFEISQGATGMTKRVLVPQIEPWYSFQLSVFDDGELVEDMSGRINLAADFGKLRHNELTEAIPGWLFVDADMVDLLEARRFTLSNQISQDLPNIANISRLISKSPEHMSAIEDSIGNGDTTAHPGDRVLLEVLSMADTAHVVRPNGLPANWLEYSCYDFVVVGFHELESIVDSDRFTALEKFVRSGGNLIVYGVGKTRGDFSMCATIDAIFLTPALWTLADAALRDVPFESLFPMQYRGRIAPSFPSVSTGIPAGRNATGPFFQSRDYFLGKIVAIGDPDPFAAGFRDWKWILADLGSERWRWYERHGMSSVRNNDDFWDLMIPGVGAAPVTVFLVLISLFVICIGPLNFWILKRMNRLYLLLFTVPVGAFVITIGLLAYAFLGDGLSTRVRNRSVTVLDSKSGRATSWSRQMYYAGLTPSNGLKYPMDAAIYPLLFRPREQRSDRFLLWDGNSQHLYNGFIQSRSLTQFLVLTAKTTEANVQIELNGNQCKAVNDLGANISQLLVMDPDNRQFFWGEDLKKGVNVELKPCSLQDARGRFAQTARQFQLEIPPGFDFPRSRRNWRYRNHFDREFSPPKSTTSALERGLGEMTLDAKPATRFYFAVLHQIPSTIPLGIDYAREMESIHLVKGTW